MNPEAITVFTNGCFDVLHPGHVDLLARARALGTRLIVGLNNDASVRAIKGPSRPLQSADARKAVLLGLSSVDEVMVYDELTPENLIQRVRPDILVKGGDWPADQIVGGTFVQGYGGKVFSLPLLGDHSSTSIIQKMSSNGHQQEKGNNLISASFQEHLDVASESSKSLVDSVEQTTEVIVDTLQRGKKLLICGNGGSAADAQHLAAEFVGRYEKERRALPAIALTTDTSAITALANDYSFDRIFSRQVEALANEGDCLIAISTSGDSPNVIAAVLAARQMGCSVISMTGLKGKRLAGLSDGCIMVPSLRTARVQEIHITVAHIWCEIVETRFAT